MRAFAAERGVRLQRSPQVLREAKVPPRVRTDRTTGIYALASILSMSPELEALDQLQGGDLSLAVLVSLFADEQHARNAIVAMLAADELILRDPAGSPLIAWQWQDLERRPISWSTYVDYRVAITETGSRRISG